MKRAVSILALGLLSAAPSFADGFRCGTKLVVEGSTRDEVATKCGEPTDVIRLGSVWRRPVVWSYGRPFYVGEDFMEIEVEAWIYNLGPNKLMRRIRFEGGVVAEIETMGYGYNK